MGAGDAWLVFEGEARVKYRGFFPWVPCSRTRNEHGHGGGSQAQSCHTVMHMRGNACQHSHAHAHAHANTVMHMPTQSCTCMGQRMPSFGYKDAVPPSITTQDGRRQNCKFTQRAGLAHAWNDCSAYVAFYKGLRDAFTVTTCVPLCMMTGGRHRR